MARQLYAGDRILCQKTARRYGIQGGSLGTVLGVSTSTQRCPDSIGPRRLPDPAAGDLPASHAQLCPRRVAGPARPSQLFAARRSGRRPAKCPRQAHARCGEHERLRRSARCGAGDEGACPATRARPKEDTRLRHRIDHAARAAEELNGHALLRHGHIRTGQRSTEQGPDHRHLRNRGTGPTLPRSRRITADERLPVADDRATSFRGARRDSRRSGRPAAAIASVGRTRQRLTAGGDLAALSNE